MHTEPFKTLYFTFYIPEVSQVKRKEKKQNATLYFKADNEITIYLKQIQNKDLIIPDENNFDFQGKLGVRGGISYIQLPYDSEKYCTDCSFVGAVHSSLKG